MTFCACSSCAPSSAVSRRQFLCTTAASAVAAASVAGTIAGPAQAQQPSGAAAAGRAILIKGGCVLTLDRALGDFEQADVLVEGGKISAVRPNISAPNAEVIDATRMIVMPGFVDTHRHMWQGILRNVLPDGSLEDYRNVVQRTFGAKYTPDDVYAGDLFSALGAIDSGVTCILDWSHIHNTPEHSDAAVKGLAESGVRAIFAYGNPQNENGRYWEMQGHKYPEDIARLRKQYFSSDDQLLTLYMAAPSASPELILGAFKAARDVGARITIHAGVGEFGRNALLEKLNAEKALKSDTTYIHCCTPNDTEWKLIRDTGGTVSIASYVETLMGHGNPPIQKAIDTGIRPSLSVDVETSVPNDFFQQMRTVFSLQKNAAARRRQEPAQVPHGARGARIRHHRRRPRQRARAQDRDALAGQGRGRYLVAHRPAQRHADEQCGWRGGHQHGPAERRYRSDRRQGDEAQRPIGRRRLRASHAPWRPGARPALCQCQREERAPLAVVASEGPALQGSCQSASAGRGLS